MVSMSNSIIDCFVFKGSVSDFELKDTFSDTDSEVEGIIDIEYDSYKHYFYFVEWRKHL